MLIEFYGRECSHCKNMEPVVSRLEREEGVKFEKFEVWHDEKNAQKMEEYDRGRCGGVPFYVNTETDHVICGEAPYDELKKLSGK